MSTGIRALCHVTLIGLVAAAALAVAPRRAAAQEGDRGQRLRATVLPDDPVLGPADALVTIVEIADFQCPYCARVRPTLQSLVREYRGDVRLVFKQNPLPFHKDAGPAAEAALAAHAEGKFWAMHDKLFDNMRALDTDALYGYAEQLGLDLRRFRRALAGGTYKAVIARDQQLAKALRLTGTPSFVINGRRLVGAQPVEKFRELIDAELAHARRMVARGTPRGAVYRTLMLDAVAEAPAEAARPASPSVPRADPARYYQVPVGISPVRGPATAKITIVEFTDFQCPFCARVQTTLAELERKYVSDLRIVLKHNPLSFHPHARLAAEASLAAHRQRKFWPMHDRLFANQKNLDRAGLLAHAEALGLDRIGFLADLDHHRMAAAIDADQKLAAEVGARGTPTFFINGRVLTGAQPLEKFVAVCDEELARANALLRRGVSPYRLYDELTRGEGAPAAIPTPPRPADPPPAAPTPAGVEEMRLKVPLSSKDPSMGPPNARVLIVLFAGFQCPNSQQAASTVHDLVSLYPRDVRVVFKQLPLPTLHAHAVIAAEAALAARAQGKFWPMHDALFGNQPALDRAALLRYADQVGLNVAKFKAALDARRFKAAVEADTKLAESLGVDGTPTFVINGRRVVGSQPIDELRKIVDAEIARAKKKR